MMKNTNNTLKVNNILQKISLVLFGITTTWLLVQTAQLLSLYYSREGWFTETEWASYFRYPDYAKYLLLIQVISLAALIITSRRKGRY